MKKTDLKLIKSCRTKKRFTTKETAKKLTKGKRLFVYHCPFCNGYHLTKQPPSKQKAIKHQASKVNAEELNKFYDEVQFWENKFK